MCDLNTAGPNQTVVSAQPVRQVAWPADRKSFLLAGAKLRFAVGVAGPDKIRQIKEKILFSTVYIRV